jgi:cytochrome c
MFDTMTLTKIGGGLFGAWLVLLLGKWAAEEIYHADAHGEQSYVIEVEDAGGDEPAEEIDFAALLAEADLDKGAKVFKKCSACHKVVEGENGTGPYLYGVVGRDIGSVTDYAYSGALTSAEGDWTPDQLAAFLTNPSGYAPGTNMAFKLKKPADQANVIAYLDSLDD